MNNKQIKKYKPLLEVVLKNGNSLFVPEKMKDALFTAIQTKPHVIINGQLYDRYEIKKVIDAKEEFNALIGQSEKIVIAVKMRMKDYYENTGRVASEEIILKWVEKLKIGQRIYS